MFRMRYEEIIEHRCGRYSCSEDENSCVFPIACKEAFIGENECRKQEDKDDWYEPEGDIGVQAEADKKSADGEIRETAGSETAEEVIEKE